MRGVSSLPEHRISTGKSGLELVNHPQQVQSSSKVSLYKNLFTNFFIARIHMFFHIPKLKF